MKSGAAPDPADPASGAAGGSAVVHSSEQKLPEQNSAEQNSAEQNSAEQDSAEQDSAEQDSAEQDSAEQDSAEQDSAEQDSAEQDSAEQDSAERLSTEGATAEHNAEPTRPTRSGRRPGNPDTRQAILDAARATFAEVGFAPASIRKIATAAGVDAALVHHYFGSKEKLFLATIEVPVDLPKMIAGLGADGTKGLGVRLAAMMLGVWESPAGAGIGAALRTALADPARARMLREFVVPQLIGPLLRPLNLSPDELEVRAALVMSQVLGVITGRYLLSVEPLASLPVDVLAANVGATLQRYFDSPLADLPTPQANS